MSITARCARMAAVVALGLLLGACTKVNNKVGSALGFDTDLKLEITSSHDINPDEQSKASPLFVYLYELKDTKNFDKADFIDLYERDEEMLGSTFIAKQELAPVLPGQVRIDRFVLSKGTRHVALFALFNRYSGAKAKVVFPVTEANVIRNAVKIKISDNTMVLVHQ